MSREAKTFCLRETTVDISDFFAADQNLCVVCVLNYNCIFNKLADIVSKNRVKKGSKGRALKNSDVVGQRVGFFDITQIVRDADTLGVILQIG